MAYHEVVNLGKTEANIVEAHARALKLIEATLARRRREWWPGFDAALERAFKMIRDANEKTVDEGSEKTRAAAASHLGKDIKMSQQESFGQLVELYKAMDADPRTADGAGFDAFIRDAYAIVNKAMLARQTAGTVALSKAERDSEAALGDAYYTLRQCVRDNLSREQQKNALDDLAARNEWRNAPTW